MFLGLTPQKHGSQKSATKKRSRKKKTNKNETSQEDQEVAEANMSASDNALSSTTDQTDPVVEHLQLHPTENLSNTEAPGLSNTTDLTAANSSNKPGNNSAVHQEPTFSTTETPVIESFSQISPLMIKQLLSCISPNTVFDGPQSSETYGNGVKFSLENLLVSQGQGKQQNAEALCTSFQGVQGQVEETDTPGQVQIPAALLQNLLHGISHPLGNTRMPTPQNISLPSIQQFASQPLQALVQSLFPQETTTLVASSTQCSVNSSSVQTSVAKSVTVENPSALSVTFNPMTGQTSPVVAVQPQELLQPSNILQQFSALQPQAINSANLNGLPLIQETQPSKQQQIFNSIVNASSQHQGCFSASQQTIGPADSAQTSQLVTASPVVSVASSVPDGHVQVRGVPLLVQQSGIPGQPVQLIPLDKNINVEYLQEIIQKITARQEVPLSKCL